MDKHEDPTLQMLRSIKRWIAVGAIGFLFIGAGVVSAFAQVAEEQPKLKYWLPFQIGFIDDGPDELTNKLPIRAVIVDKLLSPDGGEYFLAILKDPIPFHGHKILYLVVGGRFVGGGISPAMKELPINIAIVTNNELLEDEMMDFDKAEFAAIGTATATHDK